MASALIPEIPAPGFSFENFVRNDTFLMKGFKPPKTLKTGTTISGVIFDGGVVIGADTRATQGSIVADKNCDKIHVLNPNMAFGGAGTSADLGALKIMIRAHTELHRLNSGKQVPVCVATTKICQHLFRYQGYLECALVIGGVDKFGAHLGTIYPHGSYSPSVFAAMGSGSLAAMSHLEMNYKDKMTLEEAKQLIRGAILAGVENDLGSGNGIDLCIIKPEGMEIIRKYELPTSVVAATKQGNYRLAKGITPVLDSFVKFEEEETIERKIEPDRSMETS